MGTFSEMAIAEAASFQPEGEEIQPFSLETAQSAVTADSGAAGNDFEDDAEQQAEADAAKEALAKLSETKEPTAAQKKKEHEEAEAKRKAEWEAKHQEKLDAELLAWEKAVDMSDEAVANTAIRRVGSDAERITRRNMKMCVTEHIQTRCLEDADFARQIMHPRKNMVNCFKYINHKAFEFVKQEMEDNEEKQTAGGYGCDIPDDLCYKWAEEYFMDMDAKEDKDKDDEFVPKPFYGGSSSRSKKTAAKKPEKKAAAKDETTPEKEVKSESDGQLSFDSQLSISGLEVAG